MNEVWRVFVMGCILYGNYLVFHDRISAIFWALCYDTLCREVKKRHTTVLYAVFLCSNIVSVLCAVVLPSILGITCINEVYTYLKDLVVGLKDAPYMANMTDNALTKAAEYAIDVLHVQYKKDLTEHDILDAIYTQVEKYWYEIAHSTMSVVNVVIQFVFFTGIVRYFASMDRNPLWYVFSAMGRGDKLVHAFESIVHSLCASSMYNFLYGCVLSYMCDTPLIVVSGVLSGFLSIFCVVPMYLYCAPSVFLFWLQGRYVTMGVYTVGVLLQQIIGTRVYDFRFKRGCLKTLSIPLGISAFGLSGAIVGPFLVSCMTILWAQDENAKEQKDTKAAKKEVKGKKTKEIKKEAKNKSSTMEILCKNK